MKLNYADVDERAYERREHMRGKSDERRRGESNERRATAHLQKKQKQKQKQKKKQIQIQKKYKPCKNV